MKKFRITYIILALIALLASNSAMAQTATLKGRVSIENGESLEFATVSIKDANPPIGTTTDAKGYYTLKIPANKKITVVFSTVGFESQQFTIATKSGENKVLNCTMKPHSVTINPVTIKDERVRKSTFTQIDVDKIENIAGPQSGVESLIKTLPDVGSNNELSSQYSVRGGSFDENLVYINDVEVYRPFLVRSGQQEGLSIINPDMVERVMFSPGGFEAKYGDKMSSVLDITYHRPNSFGGKV